MTNGCREYVKISSLYDEDNPGCRKYNELTTNPHSNPMTMLVAGDISGTQF